MQGAIRLVLNLFRTDEGKYKANIFGQIFSGREGARDSNLSHPYPRFLLRVSILGRRVSRGRSLCTDKNQAEGVSFEPQLCVLFLPSPLPHCEGPGAPSCPLTRTWGPPSNSEAARGTTQSAAALSLSLSATSLPGTKCQCSWTPAGQNRSSQLPKNRPSLVL